MACELHGRGQGVKARNDDEQMVWRRQSGLSMYIRGKKVG